MGMHGCRGNGWLAGALVLAAMGAAGSAEAAVTFGSALDRAPSDSARTPGSCGSGCTLQQARFAGAGVTAPVDGVITVWHVRAASAVPGLRLRVIRGSAGGGSSAPVTASPGVSRHPARLTVRAGEGIGLDFSGGGSLIAADPLLTGNSNLRGWQPTLTDGADRAANMSELTALPWELLLNATVEPDADADGFGDESQDACPRDRALQTGCGGVATGQGGTAPGSSGGSAAPVGGSGDSVPSRLRISRRRLRLDRRGQAAVAVRCPSEAVAPCQGTLLLETARRVSSLSRSRGRGRRLRLGGTTFSLAPGGAARLRVPVTRKNRRILRRLRSTKVVARGNTAGEGGRTLSARVTLTLRAR